MANTWQIFEVECYKHLVNTYGTNARFSAFGKSDSTKPDIFVVTPQGAKFFIETKSRQSQCGQFVLIPDQNNKTFTYSNKNQTPFYESTQLIIDHMNKNYDEYAKAGTSGCDINLNTTIFNKWITNYYSDKGVRFFITKGSEYIIIPMESFSKYFDVSCCYRMKKSGSTAPANSNIKEIEEILKNENIKGVLLFRDKNLYLKANVNTDSFKLKGYKYNYLFKKTTSGYYAVRRLSNTANSNVIFSISLKKQRQDIDDLLQFERTL